MTAWEIGLPFLCESRGRDDTLYEAVIGPGDGCAAAKSGKTIGKKK